MKSANNRQTEKIEFFSAEGNNGGDILEITKLDAGLLLLKLGHNCVFSINHIVPVEFITAILAKAVLDADGVENAMKTADWPDGYLDKLVAKIQKVQQ